MNSRFFMTSRHVPTQLLAKTGMAVGLCVLVGCRIKPVKVVLEYKVNRQAIENAEPVDMEGLLQVINGRLAGLGRARAVGGKRIEVGLFREMDDADLERIDRMIRKPGVLEFRILANAEDHADVISRARNNSAKEVKDGNEVIARWVAFDTRQFDATQVSRFVTRGNPRNDTEVLVIVDSYHLTGDLIEDAVQGVDETGRPSVNFTFDTLGASRFSHFTAINQPNAATGFQRALGIILDDELLTAPMLREPITGGRGQISGGNFSQQEVDGIVRILIFGRLPYPLQKVAQRRLAP